MRLWYVDPLCRCVPNILKMCAIQSTACKAFRAWRMSCALNAVQFAGSMWQYLWQILEHLPAMRHLLTGPYLFF